MSKIYNSLPEHRSCPYSLLQVTGLDINLNARPLKKYQGTEMFYNKKYETQSSLPINTVIWANITKQTEKSLFGKTICICSVSQEIGPSEVPATSGAT